MLAKFMNGWRCGCKIVMSFIYLSLVISCAEPSINTEYENLKKLDGIEQSSVSIVYRDTVNIDARGTSLQGHWSVHGKQLSFADEHIVRVSMYDTLGHRLNSLFSQGRGPSEFLSPPLSFIQLSSGKYLYSDKNQNLYLLSSSEYIKEKHTNLIKAGLPARNVAKFMNDLKTTPDPDNFAMYELCFQGYDFIEYNGNLLFPVTTEHVVFNGFMKKYAPDFYKKSFTVMAVDTGKFKIENVLCKFPPVYHEKVIPNFKDCHLTTDGNLLYVCFEADPNIYVLNEKYDMLGYFGEAELEIKDDFIETFSFEEATRNFFKHRKLCGHYGNLSSFGDYVFREFFLPGNKKGIQIYRDYTLVHTLYPVKEDFTMIGYIFPYYYAVLECDIDNEIYRIIKFELI